MIFAKEPEIIEAEETGDHLIVTQGQDIAPTLGLCHDLREHDETKGWSKERKFKHMASVPDIAAAVAMQERPGVFKDSQELHKWLADAGPSGGKQFRVNKDAAPVKGNGLQVIVR